MAMPPVSPRRGEPITEEFLRALVDALVGRVSASGPIRVEQQGGTLLVQADEAPVIFHHKRFRIQNVQDDYLECKTYNATTDTLGARTIAVAKPWMLRKSSFDGNTFSYEDGGEFSYSYSTKRKRTVTNTSDSSTETQVMTPDYIAADNGSNTFGEEIIAMKLPTGLTDGSGNAIVWEDINMCGRFWAREA